MMNHKNPYFEIEMYPNEQVLKPLLYIQPDKSVKQMIDIFKALPGEEVIENETGSQEDIQCSLKLHPGEDYNLVYYGIKNPDTYEVFQKYLNNNQFIIALNSLLGIKYV